jgi:hypothetical protein
VRHLRRFGPVKLREYYYRKICPARVLLAGDAEAREEVLWQEAPTQDLKRSLGSSSARKQGE